MLGDLFRSGFDIVDDHEDADAIVVNTCSFVEEAKTESLEVHGKLCVDSNLLRCLVHTLTSIGIPFVTAVFVGTATSCLLLLHT